MDSTQTAQLFMDATPWQLYDLLMDRSTLQPLTQRSIGKAAFVYNEADPEDRTFTWTYQCCRVNLSATGIVEIDKPGKEIGLRLVGDFNGFVYWRLTPFGPNTLVALTVDYQLPDGLIGLLSRSFVAQQVDFELMLMLKNLQQIVAQRQKPLPQTSTPAAVNTLAVR